MTAVVTASIFGLFFLGFWPGLVLPLTLLVLLVLSVILGQSRRRPPNECGHCGYDLTGNVSGRCPECGRAVEREQDRNRG
ncbi:MAG: hypothetical protein C4547_13800 [Phycisphaerales bacterium]|nr:MAG: hypothetical protein C4547_13800 [Phycisphaerales bacterium]